MCLANDAPGPQDFVAISKEQEEKLALMLEKLQEYSVSLEQQVGASPSTLEYVLAFPLAQLARLIGTPGI